jgi:predicted small integral membrane protein
LDDAGHRAGRDSFMDELMDWMAWTWPTAIFFMVIASLLIAFTILAIRFPETPRIGILRIETTRGDRLFITLLGSAFINLAWLGLTDRPSGGRWRLCHLCRGGLPLGLTAAEDRSGPPGPHRPTRRPVQ